MNNIKKLRDELSNVFKGLKNGSIKPEVAKEINITAGKIIDSLKIELAYCAMKKQTPDIKFLSNYKELPPPKEKSEDVDEEGLKKIENLVEKGHRNDCARNIVWGKGKCVCGKDD
jgi:hypothetical protein